jgi:small subunit ribosomal protein S20
VRSSIRKVNEAIASGSKDDATTQFRAASGEVDSLVNKGLIHKNKASRHKSRLAAKLKALA